jgi:hypothetical protein
MGGGLGDLMFGCCEDLEVLPMLGHVFEHQTKGFILSSAAQNKLKNYCRNLKNHPEAYFCQ